MFLRNKQKEGDWVKEDKNFYIVEKNVLPEIFLKVMEAKKLLESKKERTVQDAVNKVGISRSAFYKYRDAVHPLYENTRGRTVTISINLEHKPGLLSAVLNNVADEGANILTINQNIPSNGCAVVTITAETSALRRSLEEMLEAASSSPGVIKCEILAG